MPASDLLSEPHSGRPWRLSSPCSPRLRAFLSGRWSHRRCALFPSAGLGRSGWDSAFVPEFFAVSRHCPSRESLVVGRSNRSGSGRRRRGPAAHRSAIRLRNSSGVRVQCLDGNCRATARTGHRGQPAGLRGGVGDFTRTRAVDPVAAAAADFARVRGSHRTRAERSAEAARLEYGITHAAEWLLDNAYLIRSNIADIRHDLPENHNKILPVLTDRSCLVRPARLSSRC